MKITKEWLIERGASCAGQVATFNAEWPEGGEVSRANLERARALGLNLLWFLEKVLPLTAAPWADYERVVATARADRDRVINAAWENHLLLVAAARTDRDPRVAMSRADYDRRVAAAVTNRDRLADMAKTNYNRVIAAATIEMILAHTPDT